MELDGAAVVPLLEFPDGVGAGEAARGRGGVDVDAGVFVGGLAGFFEGLGDGGGVRRGKCFEGRGFDVFVFGVFGGDRSDEAEAEFELGVEEIEGVFLEGLGRGCLVSLVILVELGEDLRGCPILWIRRSGSVQ